MRARSVALSSKQLSASNRGPASRSTCSAFTRIAGRFSFLTRLNAMRYPFLYHRLVVCVLALALSSFRWAPDQQYVDYSYTIEDGSKLSIEGTSNINSFECFCGDKIAPGTTRLQIVAPTSFRFQNTSLALRTKALDCDNSKMNSDLCDALQADDYPYITIQFHDATIVRGSLDDASEWTDLRMQATMIITDVNQRMTLDVKAKKLGPGRYRFMCSKKMKMTDFKIDPPTALFGLIRVRDEITVNFDITAKLAN